MSYSTIALDLEGTLISNALDPLPRPGLCDFLDFCVETFEHVVLMTAIPEMLSRKVLTGLVDTEHAPPGIEHIKYINWEGQYKDLRYVSKENPEQVLLVDDNWTVIHPDQEEQWIPVLPWISPYPQSDQELVEVKERILEALRSSSSESD